MNRRDLFKHAIAVAGATTVAAISPHAHAASNVEPVPLRWDFEKACEWCECDAAVSVVSDAIAKLGWSSGLDPKPLLCVHPRLYARGLDIASEFGGVLQVWATREIGRADGTKADGENIDGWLVAWRGRRCGSEGA